VRLSIFAVPEPLSGCVAYGGELSGGVVVAEGGDGVAEVDTDASGEAGR
jgi:hypothetical protein